ncbi:MAG: phosphotransferase [Erysipelotrichaceae bacterium]|nr:phosphotransferase [Erysipelotrichaceae bacterium]
MIMLDNQIKEAFTSLVNKKIHSYHVIDGGLSNISHEINDSYVIRTPSNYIQPFNDFSKEKAVLEAIEKLSISEKIVKFDTELGIKISKFVHGGLLYKETPTDEQIRLTAKTLKKLHRSGIEVPYNFDLNKRLDLYKSFAKKNTLDQRYEKKIIRQINAILSREKMVICHNDLVRGNLLYRFNKLVIIDWEYAGMNHPYFDLASFISENDLSDEQTRLFLSSYFGSKFNNLRTKKVNVFIAFNDILWYYWSLMMKDQTEKEVYEQIAILKKNRIEKERGK